MGPDRSANVEAVTDDEVVYCARHPTVETPLRCGRCETPICPRCLVQTPVGARCRECAGVTRLPTYNMSALLLLRGSGAAAVAAIVIGVVWGYLVGATGFGFFGFFIGLGIGWAISEAISLGVNRRRAPPLAFLAVAAVVLCYLTRNVTLGVDLLPRGDLGGYIATAVAAFYSVSRLNR